MKNLLIELSIFWHSSRGGFFFLGWEGVYPPPQLHLHTGEQALLLMAAEGSDGNADECGLTGKVGSRRRKQTKAEIESRSNG